MSKVSQESGIRVTVIHGREIDSGLAEQWQRIVDEDDIYSSPYLSPAYTQIAAQSREETRVALLYSEGRLVGFFPFELLGHRKAGPVGNHFSDQQAAIIERGISLCVRDLLVGANLAEWRFDHLLACQQPFRRYIEKHECSPVIDLTWGYEHYRQKMIEQRRRQLSQSEHNERRLRLKFSDFTFTTRSRSEDDLNTLLDWKRAQLARSGSPGHYGCYWENDLIRRLMDADTPAFAGVLSTLHADGRLIAAELGLRSRRVWHGWIPAYAQDLAAYSPGHVLSLSMLRASGSLGVTQIDLGKGMYPYKRRLMTGTIAIAEGVAHL